MPSTMTPAVAMNTGRGLRMIGARTVVYFRRSQPASGWSCFAEGARRRSNMQSTGVTVNATTIEASTASP